MKIVIEDGRQNFYQWDKDQRVKLEGVTLNHYVHFGRPDGGAYEVKIYKDGSWFYANVPNIWLQLSGIQKLYIVNGDKQTEHRASLFITPREKPDGYLYTETEILSFVSLDKRLRRLEGDPSVGGYATEQWVHEGFQPKGNYLGSEDLPAAIDTALAQAKESGAFDGAPGPAGPAGPQGEPGQPGEPGKDGQDGKDYVLTDDDRAEIAEQAAGLVEVPDSGGKTFIVTVTGSEGEFRSDKSPSEIYAANNEGVPVLANISLEGGFVVAYLITATETEAMFGTPAIDFNGNATNVSVTISGNDPADRTVSVIENADDSSGVGLGVTGATVGQTVKISAVDEKGVPTAWEPVDFPSGGGGNDWKLVEDFTLEEDVSEIKWKNDTAVNEIFVSLQGVANNEANDLANSMATTYLRSIDTNDKQSSNLWTGKRLFFIRTSGSFPAVLKFSRKEGFIDAHGMMFDNQKYGAGYENHFAVVRADNLAGFSIMFNDGNLRFKSGMKIEVYVR